MSEENQLKGCQIGIITIYHGLKAVFPGLIIDDGFRTSEQNAAAGGAPHSAHLTGEALDLSCPDVKCYKIAAKVLELYGPLIKGIGLNVYKNFVHIDTKNRGANSIIDWVYDRNGKYI